jgi:hypothetical protein
MGVTKDIITPGDGKTFPKTGDKLTMHYQYVPYGMLENNHKSFVLACLLTCALSLSIAQWHIGVQRPKV